MDKEIKILKNFFNNDKLKIYRDYNNEIIIEGDILIYETEYSEIPVKFHKLIGSLRWHGDTNGFHSGSLKTLKNFPDIVTGDVLIYKNKKLTSLKGCPKRIEGTLQCNDCNISDISDVSEYIGGFFIASNNPISDISVLHEIYVGSNINLINTKITEDNIIPLKNDSSVIITKHIYNDIF